MADSPRAGDSDTIATVPGFASLLHRLVYPVLGAWLGALWVADDTQSVLPFVVLTGIFGIFLVRGLIMTSMARRDQWIWNEVDWFTTFLAAVIAGTVATAGLIGSAHWFFLWTWLAGAVIMAWAIFVARAVAEPVGSAEHPSHPETNRRLRS